MEHSKNEGCKPSISSPIKWLPSALPCFDILLLIPWQLYQTFVNIFPTFFQRNMKKKKPASVFKRGLSKLKSLVSKSIEELSSTLFKSIPGELNLFLRFACFSDRFLKLDISKHVQPSTFKKIFYTHKGHRFHSVYWFCNFYEFFKMDRFQVVHTRKIYTKVLKWVKWSLSEYTIFNESWVWV